MSLPLMIQFNILDVRGLISFTFSFLSVGNNFYFFFLIFFGDIYSFMNFLSFGVFWAIVTFLLDFCPIGDCLVLFFLRVLLGSFNNGSSWICTLDFFLLNAFRSPSGSRVALGVSSQSNNGYPITIPYDSYSGRRVKFSPISLSSTVPSFNMQCWRS